MPHNYAYIRVSSIVQNTERQLDDVGIAFDDVFKDKCTGKDKNRPELQLLIRTAKAGDTIHIHSIDRLARNLDDLRMLVKNWNDRNVTVKFYKEGLTFSSKDSNPMSELMLSMLGAIAQFERAMIKERQKEGIAIAKKNGVYKGRSTAMRRKAEVVELLNSGVSQRKIAEQLGISLSSVQRIVKKFKAKTLMDSV